MASLHNLSASHAATREFDVFIDKTTIRSFILTLFSIVCVFLSTSLLFNGFTIPLIKRPTIIVCYPPPKLPTQKPSNPQSSNGANAALHRGEIGSKAVSEEPDTLINDSFTDTPIVGDGDGYGSDTKLSDGIGSELGYGSAPLNVVSTDEEQEEEFSFMPEVEPIIDLDVLNRNIRYPDMAIKLGREGEVVLKVLITEAGNVGTIDILSSTSSIFNRPAIDALNGFRTNPARNNGKAVPYIVYIPIKFKLR